MYSKRLVHFVLVALSVSTATQAAWMDVVGRGIHNRGLAVRQSNDDENTTSAGTATQPGSTTRVATIPTTPTSAAVTTPTSATVATTPKTSTAVTPTTTTAPTTASSRLTSSNPVSSSQAVSSSTAGSTTGSASLTSSAPSVQTTIVVITTTNADGVATTQTTSAVITPTQASQGTTSSGSGMDSKTKSTVIGVVVGIGGAIVLGVVGLLAWRIWGRKKHQEERDGLMDYGGPNYNAGPAYNAGPEKSEAGGSSNSGRSPFQSTLESYHAPSHTNAASNF